MSNGLNECEDGQTFNSPLTVDKCPNSPKHNRNGKILLIYLFIIFLALLIRLNMVIGYITNIKPTFINFERSITVVIIQTYNQPQLVNKSVLSR